MVLSRLVYDRKGSGEPVVLIHGIGHRRQAWIPIFDQLAEKYDVIAADLAGFGESPAYPKSVPYDMDTACLNLVENFELWGIEKPHVVGNSLGGVISLELGARNLVSSVTALSPAGFFGPISRFQAFFTLFILRIASQLPDRLLHLATRSMFGRKMIGRTLYAHPERFDAQHTYEDAIALKNASAFERTIKAGIKYKFDSHIPVPTTIAWATKDRILPYSQSAIAAERLPEARHVALPHCGHVPMVDDPELVLRVINETIADTHAGESPLAETA